MPKMAGNQPSRVFWLMTPTVLEPTGFSHTATK